MLPRRSLMALWCLLLAAAAEEAPPGLVSKDSEQDLVAEATNTGPAVAQKREAALSNSYGDPLPADAYGPPSAIPVVPDLPQPAPVYGVPDFGNSLFQTPPGAYGPPSPIVFPSQQYEGPPPPLHKPKPIYGPPKQVYGPPKIHPPKQVYGPPKKTYGPPKQNLPKPLYGAPFKPPKLSLPKPIYGVPKVNFAPKPVYGPPKVTYGTPINGPAIPLQFPQQSLPQSHSFDSVDLGVNLPAPIYGTPIPSLPLDLKPSFPIPADTYGPPGHVIGPIGPNDQVVVHGGSNVGHYGPPQPDPNPKPPHPGIPAPPTPPRVLYDGWKPIPGVSKPLIESHHEFGQPPPVQEAHIQIHDQGLPNIDHGAQFSGAQISSGYSSVHQDALANIDLKALVGGESNDIDQSKTVFEAHYTENHHNPEADLALIQSLPSGLDLAKPHDTYGAPPLDSLSGGPYPSSLRQQGAKGLVPPSGVYGVPPGSQYGAPPRPSNLPIGYGHQSGGGHSGGHIPRHPIKFREPVPDGLIQHIGHVTHHKDVHIHDHNLAQPAYLPPPVRELKDVNQELGNHGIAGLSLSIEPSNLYSLPHAGNPINFQGQHQPSSLYGSPIDSYSVPLFTVDHTGSASSVNEVKTTLDGNFFANLSSLEAAAILKHCPYHEAILKAAKAGEKIPADLASSYVASLSSLGSALSQNQQAIASNNLFNLPDGSASVSFSNKDLATASHTLVQTVVPNEIKGEKTEKTSVQKGKSLKEKHSFKDDKLTDQIKLTSERIKNLSDEANQLQQKIVSTNQNLNLVNSQISGFDNIPVKGKFGSYSLQIQAADGHGKPGNPSIPHEQLLSEGLLQSILQAIEQPSQNKQQNVQFTQNSQQQNVQFTQNAHTQNSQTLFTQSLPTKPHAPFKSFPKIDEGGLVLPAGYEPVDRTKEKKPVFVDNAKDQEIQATNQDIKSMLHSEIIHKHRGDIPQTECDLRADNSVTHTIVVPPPSVDKVKPVEEIDENDVAIFFDEKSDQNEPVTEISVATSISENVDVKMPEFGDKLSKRS